MFLWISLAFWCMFLAKAEYCPENCTCYDLSAQCDILSPSSELPEGMTTIQIYGTLAPHHRSILAATPWIFLYLDTDRCGALANCRYFIHFVLKTSSLRFLKINNPPKTICSRGFFFLFWSCDELLKNFFPWTNSSIILFDFNRVVDEFYTSCSRGFISFP